jgi:hypothetical protein
MIEDINITEDMYVPEVLAAYPSTRRVFDRYGLKGFDGPTGPQEPISWFARLHGVPVNEVLLELRIAAANGTTRIGFAPSIAGAIYRPFFLAGVGTVLTLGCMWGAINLLQIGWRRDFTAANYSWVLAHVHAMVFGFVGFFIMGFAYQVFPRFKQTTLWRPRLAFAALPLMIAGIVLQTLAHLMAPATSALPLEFVAAAIQIAAVAIFGLVILNTMRSAGKPESYDRFIYAGLGWFLVAAIANPIIFKAFELPENRSQLLFNLATFNIPYRDVQLLGIAVVIILGVSLKLLPQAYGLREPSAAWQSFLFWGVNSSIFFGALTFIAGMSGHNHWLLLAQWLTTLVLFAAAVGNVFAAARVPGGFKDPERSRSEIRSRGLPVVYRSDGDARAHTALQLWHLHAAHRLASSLFTRLFRGLSSRAYGWFHHDDDRWRFQQSCPNSFRR